MIKVTQKESKSWVTFTLPAETGTSVEICGSWNEWQKETLKPKKNGEFSITKVLPNGENYEFGYIIDGSGWVCDGDTECIDSPFDSKNSLLAL